MSCHGTVNSAEALQETLRWTPSKKDSFRCFGSWDSIPEHGLSQESHLSPEITDTLTSLQNRELHLVCGLFGFKQLLLEGKRNRNKRQKENLTHCKQNDFQPTERAQGTSHVEEPVKFQHKCQCGSSSLKDRHDSLYLWFSLQRTGRQVGGIAFRRDYGGVSTQTWHTSHVNV